MITPILALTALTATGSALMAGTFFAFSTFVMGALGRLPAPEGIRAMQSINVVVLNRWFLGVFLGTAALSLALGVLAVVNGLERPDAFRLAGALLYVIGTFLVTAARNVPLNDALAAVSPDSQEGAEVWARYLRDWTRWNHVRTVAPTLATVCYLLSVAA